MAVAAGLTSFFFGENTGRQAANYPSGMTILDSWAREYGLVIVFVGTFFEGEGVVLAASLLAVEGVFSLPAVCAVAAAGAWSGHLFWFALGRFLGSKVVARNRKLAERSQRIVALISRHPKVAIVLVQYLYGARVAGAVAFGLTNFPAWKFAAYELVNCAVWAAGMVLVASWIGEEARLYQGPARWIWIGATLAVVAWLLHRVSRVQEEQAADHARP